MLVLPKIAKDRIYLSISSSLSSLESLGTVSANGVEPGASNTSSSIIQVPSIDAKNFNQRSMVESGTTLILAGFRQVRNTANESSLFGVKPLGGHAASQVNMETVVLITPIILGKMH